MNVCHICGIPSDAGFFDESTINDAPTSGQELVLAHYELHRNYCGMDSGMPERGSKLEKAATVIHELAHALLRDRLYQDFCMLPKHPWTFGIPPSDPVSEDIATSVCFFLIRPGELRKRSPPRYELLKKQLRFSKCQAPA